MPTNPPARPDNCLASAAPWACCAYTDARSLLESRRFSAICRFARALSIIAIRRSTSAKSVPDVCARTGPATSRMTKSVRTKRCDISRPFGGRIRLVPLSFKDEASELCRLRGLDVVEGFEYVFEERRALCFVQLRRVRARKLLVEHVLNRKL